MILTPERSRGLFGSSSWLSQPGSTQLLTCTYEQILQYATDA